jgi:hypothetical protein
MSKTVVSKLAAKLGTLFWVLWGAVHPEMIPATPLIPQQNPSSHNETGFPSRTPSGWEDQAGIPGEG